MDRSGGCQRLPYFYVRNSWKKLFFIEKSLFRVVRRVLVLIQVAALRAARQAHALQQFDRRNIKKAPTDARSPLSRLAILRMISVGADIDFVDWGLPLLSQRSAVSWPSSSA